jgi:hypothetical protein
MNLLAHWYVSITIEPAIAVQTSGRSRVTRVTRDPDATSHGASCRNHSYANDPMAISPAGW